MVDMRAYFENEEAQEELKAETARLRSQLKEAVEALKILFPEPVKSDLAENLMVSHCAALNLSDAICDIESGRCDAIIIDTLKHIEDQLTRARARARAVLDKLKDGGA